MKTKALTIAIAGAIAVSGLAATAVIAKAHGNDANGQIFAILTTTLICVLALIGSTTKDTE